MKIIHCADLHLDSKIDGIPQKESKIRREEIMRTFEKLTEYAKSNGVSAVILAGDVFDTPKISSRIKLRFLDAVYLCDGVDFFIASGNHDNDLLGGLSDNVPPNLHFFSDVWQSYSFNGVTVSGINLNPKNSLSVYDTLNLKKEDVNIVVMHGQVVGYKSESDEEIISIPKLRDKNIDYLALGHIHSFSEGDIDFRGKYAYSGCLDGRGFDELGEKGFVLIDVQDKKLSYSFVKFSSRELYELDFDVSEISDFLSLRDNILAKSLKSYPQTSLIKVVLTGERNANLDLDVEGLDFRLNENFFFAKVYDKTKLKINVSDFENDKSVKGEFVRTVLSSDLKEELKSDVISMGLKYLREGGENK